MVSSQITNSPPDYLKDMPDCKGEIAPWPVGADTESEAALKDRIMVEGVSENVVPEFQQLVYSYFAAERRELPWRDGNDPWRVLVSEVMLQQTQAERVLPKFVAFVERFPNPLALAESPLSDLLTAWQGLGYNRRALNLQRAARVIVEEWNGMIPDTPLLLRQLPGIGPYTAGAIAAFAFNRPQVFLETNIRAVLLHFFFSNKNDIPDTTLLPFATAVLDHQHPRNWYNALMDYGSDLKRRFPNPSRSSRHHTVQSRFEGSDRQIRGAVLRLLLGSSGLTMSAMQKQLQVEPERFKRILEGLELEGFAKKQGRVFKVL